MSARNTRARAADAATAATAAEADATAASARPAVLGPSASGGGNPPPPSLLPKLLQDGATTTDIVGDVKRGKNLDVSKMSPAEKDHWLKFYKKAAPHLYLMVISLQKQLKSYKSDKAETTVATELDAFADKAIKKIRSGILPFFLRNPILSTIEVTNSNSKGTLNQLGLDSKSGLATEVLDYVFSDYTVINPDATPGTPAAKRHKFDCEGNRHSLWHDHGLGKELVKAIGAKRNSYCSAIRTSISKSHRFPI